MKNIQPQLKFLAAIAFVLLIGVSGAFAQKDDANRYLSEAYRIAFELPENSSKSPTSTETSVIFNSDDPSGVGGVLGFDVGNESPEMLLSALINRNAAAENALLTVFKTDIKTTFESKIVTVLERKRIKIGGINAYRIGISYTVSGIKMRMNAYFIFVLEHKRIYVFKSTAAMPEFVKWAAAAEKSAFSFEVLKAGGK